MYLKLLEKQGQTKSQISRWGERAELEAEVNELEMKNRTNKNK